MFKKTDLIGLVAGTALTLSFLGPVTAQAAPLTPTQVNAITNLLQAFGADPATIANVQAVLSGTAPVTSSTTPSTSVPSTTPTTPSVSGCNVLPGNIGFGASGEDVSRLQAFLSKDSSIYPQGLVTGYYGQATEDAVQRWQAAHNVVASGTPMTTGFGVIGPMTRGIMNREMEMECEGGDHANVNATASSTTSGDSSSSRSGDN